MRLDDQRESGNYVDQRGEGGGAGGRGGFNLGGMPLPVGRLGIGGVLVLVVLSYLFAGPGGETGGPAVDPQGQAVAPGEAAAPDAAETFLRRVLGSTEDTWNRIYAAQGEQYPAPTLVRYSGTGSSGCGVAQSAVGPFYCPADQRIYIDTSFFDELSRRFGAPGDFAQAYVIAHEVGHHIQTIDGTAAEVRRLQSSASDREANAAQVRMELQADCYAGVWGAANRDLLEPGDIEEALTAAQAIGDDTLQRQAQGRVVPDSFTHGSSAQRMRWFRAGYDAGDPDACDTFAARTL